MKDLLRLYSFESVHCSQDEQDIFDWICKWLDEHEVPYDTLGKNIYSLQGNDFILSAHLDQVKTNGKVEHLVLTKDDNIVGYNNKWRRTSLGADDKNGVWLILKMLEKGQDIDFIISEGEEFGCVGIEALEKVGVLNSITDEQICLVLDRRGNYDILKGGGSTTYCDALARNLCNFLDDGSDVTTGSLSDTATICKHCESVNMSVAYFNPHTATEYTDWSRLNEILNNLEYIVEEFVHYPSKPTTYTKSTTSNYYRGKYDDYDYYRY